MRSPQVALQILESKFCSFPAKSLLFRVGGRLAGTGGRAAGEIEIKANSGQIQLNLPVGLELGNSSKILIENNFYQYFF